jgi:hypothetical protein
MTDLIACLSTGKGTWAHVSKLIEEQEWDNVFLITNEFGIENFKPTKKVEYILINSKRFLPDLIEDIKAQLKEKVNPTDVAVNLISGSGKEHMAILSALLKLGLGIRLTALTVNGVKEV